MNATPGDADRHVGHSDLLFTTQAIGLAGVLHSDRRCVLPCVTAHYCPNTSLESRLAARKSSTFVANVCEPSVPVNT